MELFDTTYLIDLANNDPGALKEASEIDSKGTTPAISVITVHEYLLGVHLGNRNSSALLMSKLARARQDISGFEVIPLTQEIMELSSKIESDLLGEGRLIGINDVYIAATAMHYNMRLITRNSSHFKRISGLTVGSY